MNTEQFDSFFINDGLPITQAIKRYHNRRLAFLKHCHVFTVLTGVTEPLSQHNHWLNIDTAIYQEPNMLYLTGLNQPNVALIANPTDNTITLFLATHDETKIFWEGPVLGFQRSTAAELASFLHVDAVLDYDQLFDYVYQYLNTQKNPVYSLFWHSKNTTTPQQADCYDRFKQDIMLFLTNKGISQQPFNCEEFMQYRLCLDKVDQHNLSCANQLTATVFKQCLGQLHQFESETQVAGFIKGAITTHSWFGESFPPIVAAGKNAAILHYRFHHSMLTKNSLLLLDFGCKHFTMPADISRTVPINGRFNPLQALLYSIVLAAQSVVEKAAKAGVTIKQLNDLCWKFVETELENTFFKQGGQAQRPYKTQPHNVSHLIAHTVHDGDRYRKYRTTPLTTGMVISNEPGLYGQFSMTIDGVEYNEHIGIRIEDNLLITDKGCDNLSKDCPKTIADIEALFTNK